MNITITLTTQKLNTIIKVLPFTLFCFVFFQNVDAIAQDKSVFIELEKLQKPMYNEVKGKGVLVSYSEHIKNKKITTTSVNLSFYDLELNKIWEKKGIYSIEMDIKTYRSDPYYLKSILVSSVIDSEGQYIYYYQPSKKSIIQINITNGNIKTKEIETPYAKSNYSTYCFNADDNFFYIIHKLKEHLITNKEGIISIMKFDTKTLNQKNVNFKIPPVGKGNIRHWDMLGISKYGAYFGDNYFTELKNTKEYFKRILSFNLDGTVKSDSFVKTGNKIGDCAYNIEGKGYLYVFSLMRNNQDSFVSYSCYNRKMKLEWKKKYDSDIISNTFKFTINPPASFKMLNDSSIIIRSYYGLNEYFFEYKSTINTFDFEILKDKNTTCNMTYKYDLDCSSYIKLSKYKNCKFFMDNDMENTKGIVLVNPFFFQDRVIISKKNYRLLKDQYISLHMFKL